MNFKEILTNPAKFFWDAIERKKSTSVSQPSDSTKMSLGHAVEESSGNKLNEVTQIVKEAGKKDWGWILRGKTGLFIKVTLALIIVLVLIEPFIVKPTVVSVKPPEQIDQGDKLDTPPFEPVNYIYGAENNGDFLLYSPKINQISEVGTRGIVLSSINTESVNRLYFPVTKDVYLYLNGTTLYIHYLEEVQVRVSNRTQIVLEERNKELLTNIASINNIENLHKTADNNIALTLVSQQQIQTEEASTTTQPVTETRTLMVYNLTGELIEEYAITGDVNYLYSYFNGEIYFIQQSGSNYYLKKLNANKEEILSTNTGTFKPHRLYILNDNRFLVLFEQPSENTFFYVKMLDSNGSTFFNFTPKEEVKKLTKVDSLAFDPQDNQVLMVGTEVAKLFNINGDQLWIR